MTAPKPPTPSTPRASTRDDEPSFDPDFLYECLRDPKLSIADIAAMHGVTRQTIYRWRQTPRFKIYAAQMADAIFERAESRLSSLYEKALDTIAAGMEADRAVVVGDGVEMVPDHGTRTNSARVAIEETRRSRTVRTIVDDHVGVPRDRTDLIERVRKAAEQAQPQRPEAN